VIRRIEIYILGLRGYRNKAKAAKIRFLLKNKNNLI
jgi:hypothetical protein